MLSKNSQKAVSMVSPRICLTLAFAIILAYGNPDCPQEIQEGFAVNRPKYINELQKVHEVQIKELKCCGPAEFKVFSRFNVYHGILKV